MRTFLKAVIVVCAVAIVAVLAIVFLTDSTSAPAPVPTLAPAQTPEVTPTPTPTAQPTQTPTPTAEPIEYFTLSVSIEPEGAGTVSPYPYGGEFERGSELVLEAVPDPDYQYGGFLDTVGLTQTEHAVFDRWSHDASGNSPTATIVMDGDKLVVAHFVMVPLDPIGVSATELAEAYAVDEAEANQEYQHRLLRVTGDVTEVHAPGPHQEGYLMLSGGSSTARVMCSFENSQEIADVVIGDGVAVVGTCSLFHSDAVLMTGCSLED